MKDVKCVVRVDSLVWTFFLAQALIEMGEAMKQMADVKYSLDDNIKQNFLEPLHHLQTKDLKEVMVRKIYEKSFQSTTSCSRNIYISHSIIRCK